VDRPEVYRQQGGGVVLAEGADWIEATRELRDPSTRHELDSAKSGGA
jgi:hypothetical protein